MLKPGISGEVFCCIKAVLRKHQSSFLSFFRKNLKKAKKKEKKVLTRDGGSGIIFELSPRGRQRSLKIEQQTISTSEQKCEENRSINLSKHELKTR